MHYLMSAMNIMFATHGTLNSLLAYLLCTMSCALCAELRIAFSMFDKDGDGHISAQEVRETMQSLGIHIEPRHVKLMVKKVDTDGE